MGGHPAVGPPRRAGRAVGLPGLGSSRLCPITPRMSAPPRPRPQGTMGGRGGLGAPPGWREGSGRGRGSAGGVGCRGVRVAGGRVGGVDGGADGVVGRLRGTDRWQAVSWGARGDPGTPPFQKSPVSYVASEEPLQEAALGGLGQLPPVQVGGAGPARAEHVEVIEALGLNHLGGQVPAGVGTGSSGSAAMGQDPPAPPVPHSARGWRRCRWRTWRRNRCQFGPG